MQLSKFSVHVRYGKEDAGQCARKGFVPVRAGGNISDYGLVFFDDVVGQPKQEFREANEPCKGDVIFAGKR